MKLTIKMTETEKLAFQKAILAGDPVAGLAYADRLEEIGDDKGARDVRRWAANTTPWVGGEQMLHYQVRLDLIVKADRLATSQTAFPGWYGTGWSNREQRYSTPGLGESLEKGYVPTLRKGKALQARLGGYLEAMGYRVFWIS